MADEARSLKAYGELPDSSKHQMHFPSKWPVSVSQSSVILITHLFAIPAGLQKADGYLPVTAVRVNETDTFADEDGANDEYFDFEDISGTDLCSSPGAQYVASGI